MNSEFSCNDSNEYLCTYILNTYEMIAMNTYTHKYWVLMYIHIEYLWNDSNEYACAWRLKAYVLIAMNMPINIEYLCNDSNEYECT